MREFVIPLCLCSLTFLGLPLLLARARKRLLANAMSAHRFYTFIFTKSQDRHVVYHIVTQLELLPNWTHLAMQQVGDEGGPISEEFAVSSQELEWCAFPPPPSESGH